MKIPTNVFKKAISVAQSSNVKRGKVGAVIYTSKGKIVTFAANTTFYGNSKKFTIHAEEFAILKLNRLNPYRFKKLNILVVRYRKCDGKLSIAKPCRNCQNLIDLAKMNVQYTNRCGDVVSL